MRAAAGRGSRQRFNWDRRRYRCVFLRRPVVSQLRFFVCSFWHISSTWSTATRFVGPPGPLFGGTVVSHPVGGAFPSVLVAGSVIQAKMLGWLSHKRLLLTTSRSFGRQQDIASRRMIWVVLCRPFDSR
jgi:hypothetical protein